MSLHHTLVWLKSPVRTRACEYEVSSSCLKKVLSALPDQVFCSRHPSEQLTCKSLCLCWPEKLILLIWLITHPWAEHHASPLLSQTNDNSSSSPSQPFLPKESAPLHGSIPTMWAIPEMPCEPFLRSQLDHSPATTDRPPNPPACTPCCQCYYTGTSGPPSWDVSPYAARDLPWRVILPPYVKPFHTSLSSLWTKAALPRPCPGGSLLVPCTRTLWAGAEAPRAAGGRRLPLLAPRRHRHREANGARFDFLV